MTRALVPFLLGLFLMAAPAAYATVYYVDVAKSNNNNNGQSWANAKKDLQAAIDAAANNDEIWVKAGTYLPTRDANGLTNTWSEKTFVLTTKDVKLYGGFSGTETQLSQRNAASNVTILSGDINATVNGTVVDAYHVLLLIDRTSACVIDGFTISNGVAMGGTTYRINTPLTDVSSSAGAGMYNANSNPVVTNCKFSNNTASDGGGIYNNTNSSPTVTNCVFLGNSAGTGGGISNDNTSSSLSNCTFTSNTATSSGGGVYNEYGNPTVSNCVFSNNSAASYNGGAIYSTKCTGLSISSCTFKANTSNSGGGVGIDACGSTTITNCVFSANTASASSGGSGGGICSGGSSSPTITNCVFSGNTATNSGGGIYAGGYTGTGSGGYPTISNCTFNANSADVGGGIYGYNTGGSITNCILYGNTATNSGFPNRQNLFETTIAGVSKANVSYCLIGDYSATATNNYTSGAGIITGDPLFVNASLPAGGDGVFRTADDGLRIGCTSPARDLGDGTTPAADILGNARVGNMDMGAYENLGTGCPNIQYVDGSRTTNGNGFSWVSAKKDVQEAINLVTTGGEVWVKGGTYLPTRDANGSTTPTDNRDKTFYLTSADIKLYGGFSGTETANTQRNPATNLTTLSGDLDGTGGTADAYHVLLTTFRNSTCVVDGFTVSGGRATGSGTFSFTNSAATIYRSDAGGMLHFGSNIQISNCVIRNNTSGVFGGGIYNVGGTPYIINCTLSSNLAGERGGAMANNGTSLQVINCTFTGNTATIRGGGMYNAGGSPQIRNCVFSSNNTSSLGGGMYNEASTPSVTSCVFNANNASSTGGGMYNEDGSPAISSCTFRANTATSFGGGLYSTANSSGSVTNCILFGNTGGPANRQNIYKDAGAGTLSVSYSLIGDYSTAATNNYTAANSFAGDPVFVNAASPAGADGIFRTSDDGLRIDCASPARDMGTGTTPGTDIVGNARVGTLDMGAYENTGTGCSNFIQYVDGSKPTNGNGYGWGGAKRDLQDAINAVTAGGEVWVKAGTHLPTQDANGSLSPADNRDKTFFLTTKDVKLYGGFSGTETANTQRNPATNVTTLSGDLDGAGGTADAYHVLLTLNRTTATVVDGFTISGGRATGNTTFTVTTPSATVNQKFGGGVFNQASSPTLTNCIVTTNTATTVGGGMTNGSASNPVLTNCTFLANTSSYGGGIYNSLSSPVLTGCVFSGNNVTNNGGGMQLDNSSHATIRNCVFSGNSANGGGALYVDLNSNPVVSSSTFSGNTANTIGAGLWYGSSCGGTVTNCVTYGNTGGPVDWQNLFGNGTSTLTVSYTVVGNYNSNNAYYVSGSGIVSDDPLFVNAANPAGADGKFGTADDGLALRPCSPAINAGTTPSPALATDFLNNNRIGAYDLGAYEYQSTASAPTLATATTTSTQTQYTGGATSFGDCNTTIAMLFSSGSQPIQGAVSAKVYVQTTTPMLGQTPYVRRYYDITPTTNPNSATAQVTLYFTQADFDTYNSVRGSLPSLPINAADAANYKANIRVTQEHGTSVSGLPGSYSGWAGSGPAKVLINPTAISWNNVASRWEVTFPITGFSGFFLNSASAAPLPLKLIAFNAGKVHGAQNKVEWITASEDGNTVFTVERSADAKTFEALGTRTGTGLRQGSRYRFDDYTPNGDAYYRLKIREASGVETYSNTILVKGEATLNPGISIAPNPTSGLVSISCTDQALLGKMVTVTGMDSRVLRQFVLDAITSLDVQPWAAGIYLLHLPDGTVLRLLKH